MIGKVLVLDDDLDICNILSLKIKSEFDCEVITASNPQLALDLFHQNQNQIECVISDYYMPIENGASFCQIVKQNHPGLKVILLTADRNIKAHLTGKEHINVILYKPEGIEQVLEHLKKI